MNSKQMPIVYITNELAQQTAGLLESFALRRPSEGVVYWFGIESESAAIVTTLIVPDANTADGSIRTSAAANAAAVGVIIGTPLVYLGQAHSHPGSHVLHSKIDDQETFARFDGAISVVVPWFGKYGLHVEECGVHRHLSGRFREIRDIDAHLRILPGLADLRSAIGERVTNE
jgi:hypothetical protein